MRTLGIKSIVGALFGIASVIVGASFIWKDHKTDNGHLGIVQPTSDAVPFETLELNSDSSIVYEGQFGTEVTIPKNAFVNKKGESVSGPVEVKIREFHGLKDVFLSGITMQSEKGDEVMQSSGMIELRAYQGEDTLELASDKTIDVKLAATGDPDQQYNLFYLENDRSWSAPKTFETVKDDQRDARLAEAEKLNMESDSVFEIRTAYEGRPFLRMWKGVNWQLFNCEGELPYSEVKNVIWDYVHVKPLDEKRKLFSIDMVSTMHTFNGSTKQYETNLVARPVLSDLDLAAVIRKGETIETKLSAEIDALFEKEKQDAERVEKELNEWKQEREQYYLTMEQRKAEAIAEYEDQLRQQQEYYLRQASRAALFSKFSANQLGIWNIDSYQKMELVEIYCDVKMDDKEIDLSGASAFLLLEDVGSVIRLKEGGVQKLPKNETNCSMVIVYEDGWIGFIDADEYTRKINQRSIGGSTVELKGKKIDNDSLDQKLGEIGEQNQIRWRPQFS